MTDPTPLEILERTFRRWWLILLAVLLGGLAGWLSSFFLKPIYEAHAEVLINLDSTLWAQENHVGDPNDLAIYNSQRPIIDFFFSDEVLGALESAAGGEGIAVDRDTIFTTFTIQRINMTWLLNVRAGDAQTAARLADLWVQSALPLFPAPHAHAVNAYALTLERDALAACFAGAALAEGNRCAGTAFASLADLQPALAGYEERIAAERDLSMRLDPAMTIEPGASAGIPAEPVRFRRMWLGLAGTLAGLIAGILLSQTGFPARKEAVREE